MYHRIADEPVDFWRLAVTSAHFKEHLDVVRRTRQPFSLTEFVRRLMAGSLPSNAITLTFDDGYLDNLLAAKPCLAAADVPAMVFVATGYLDRPGEIWSDELAKLIFLGTAPQGLEVAIRYKIIHLELGAKSSTHKNGTVRPTKVRIDALKTMWQALRLLTDGERQTILAGLRSAIHLDFYPVTPGRAMTTSEVRALVSDGLVTIGAHTVTHPVLSALDAADSDHEIRGSKGACEKITGTPVHGFAYPYGDFDGKDHAAVRAAGFTFACSSRHGPALPTSDIFALPRIRITNVNGDAFERDLRGASVVY